MRHLQIALAEDEPDTLEYLQGWLNQQGHKVATARTGRELVELCREHRPELIITDIRMPDMDGIEAVTQICKDRPIPVVLISGHSDTEYIQRAQSAPVLAYLVKPVTGPALEPAIAVAISRFEEFQSVQKEAGDLRQALEDRKSIERAKGILMKTTGMDEAEAFRRLRDLSMDQNKKIVEIAQMILTAEVAMRMPEKRRTGH